MTKIKTENFTIDISDEKNSDDTRLLIEVEGLGCVTIVKTQEGLIIDDHNTGYPIIDEKVIDYYTACKELLRDYYKDIEAHIKVVAGKGLFLGITPSEAVGVFYEDQYFLEYDKLMVYFNKDYQGDEEGMVDRALELMLKPCQAVELFYKENPIDLNLLVGIKGECKEFREEVRNLTRPYINLSYSQFKHLKDQDFDYYMLGDSVVTFGDADGGYALMPVDEKRKKELLSLN